ncbi:MAG TPA: ADP-ribosylglycohydrolase family protein [Planctomycetota bacterium]|nr:ADP-ribosylglycohydrolase family protein [Planctomycetota bacterium]
MNRRDADHFTGCLIGGAIGDALGAPVEFMSLGQIRSRFGPDGVTDFAEAYGRLGAITDDTQMTLFTAEGLLRGHSRQRETGTASTVEAMHRAYLRWLKTQGMASRHPAFADATRRDDNGWLLGLRALHTRRAPGNTCLSALCSAEMGTIERPLNDSNGCGGVMRIAPVGLFFNEPAEAFDVASEVAAITHGHPSGYLSAGCFAAIIAGVIAGQPLAEATRESVRILKDKPEHGECLAALEAALDLASSRSPSPEVVESMGDGWVGEEALAISVYCALSCQDDYAKGVLLAVNHSGDSDSTGAIAGNILGALLGESAVPSGWLTHLELRETTAVLALDLLVRYKDDDAWLGRYPRC